MVGLSDVDNFDRPVPQYQTPRPCPVWGEGVNRKARRAVRRSILYWSLAFISTSGLAGCGFLQHARIDHCENCGAPIHRSPGKRVFVSSELLMSRLFAKIRFFRPFAVTDEYRDPMDTEPIEMGTEPPENPLTIPPLPVPDGKKVDGKDPITIEMFSSTELANPFPRKLGQADPAVSLKRDVHIQYGHTEKFTSVTGQVQAWRKTWRLRYAAIDQEDSYGGTVVLEGGAELSKLREGQHVRVRGVLIPPTDRNDAARYRVQAIEILD